MQHKWLIAAVLAGVVLVVLLIVVFRSRDSTSGAEAYVLGVTVVDAVLFELPSKQAYRLPGKPGCPAAIGSDGTLYCADRWLEPTRLFSRKPDGGEETILTFPDGPVEEICWLAIDPEMRLLVWATRAPTKPSMIHRFDMQSRNRWDHVLPGRVSGQLPFWKEPGKTLWIRGAFHGDVASVSTCEFDVRSGGLRLLSHLEGYWVGVYSDRQRVLLLDENDRFVTHDLTSGRVLAEAISGESLEHSSPEFMCLVGDRYVVLNRGTREFQIRPVGCWAFDLQTAKWTKLSPQGYRNLMPVEPQVARTLKAGSTREARR